MADTRCANPEYQLDVDLMILEYLLYRTLSSFFDTAKSPPPSAYGLNDIERGVLVVDEGILRMFDAFIRVFRINHADYELATATRFNISLLETVLLLREHELSINERGGRVDQTGAKPRRLQRREWEAQIQERQTWCELRSTLERQKSDELSTVQKHIFDAWSSYQAANEQAMPPQHPPSPLFGVLHRFMVLSSNIGKILQSNYSERLTKLACDTMLQTALEVLSATRGPHQPTDQPSGNGHEENYQYATPTLRQIFAYGYIPQLSKTNSGEKSLYLINDMFSEGKSDTGIKTSITQENPTWTSIRHSTILELQIPQRLLHDHGAYSARLTRLKHKYPYMEFRATLLRCLEHLWGVYGDLNKNGKPVLVQIEEGSLKGLSKVEFEEFLINCGIKRDRHGKIIVGLNLEGSLRASLFPRQESTG